MNCILIVISILSSASLLFNIVFTCDTIWKSKINKFGFIKIIVLVLFFLCSIIVPISRLPEYLYRYSSIVMATYYIILFLSVKILIKTKIRRIVYVVLLYISADSLIGSSFIIVSSLLQVGTEVNDIVLYSSSLIFNLSCIIVMQLCRKRIIFKNINHSMALVPKSIYILLFLVIFIAGGLVSSQISEFESTDLKTFFPQFFTIIITLVLLVTVMYLLFNCVSQRYYENISLILDNQVKKQIEHYDKLEEIYSDLRAFKHDYNNHMLCIKSMIELESNEEAMRYIENLTSTFYEKQRKFDTGNYITDALFNEKDSICKQKRITLNHEGVIPPSHVEASDICIVFSNLLDNAIEACDKTGEGERFIDVATDFKFECLYIKVTNTVSESVIIQNNSIASTKEDKINHGFGLLNIRRIADKYNGCVEMKCIDKLFIIEVTLYSQ